MLIFKLIILINYCVTWCNLCLGFLSKYQLGLLLLTFGEMYEILWERHWVFLLNILIKQCSVIRYLRMQSLIWKRVLFMLCLCCIRFCWKEYFWNNTGMILLVYLIWIWWLKCNLFWQLILRSRWRYEKSNSQAELEDQWLWNNHYETSSCIVS